MIDIPTCVFCGAPALPNVGMPHSPDCVSYRGPVHLVFVRSEETANLPVGLGSTEDALDDLIRRSGEAAGT